MIILQTEAGKRVWKQESLARAVVTWCPFLPSLVIAVFLASFSVSLVTPERLLTMQNDKDQEVMDPLTSEKDVPSPLPVPVSTQPQKPKLTAVVIIPVWIVLSSTVIIYNNYIYNTLYFKYPVFLVTWHLAFAVCRFFSCYSSATTSFANSSGCAKTNETLADHRVSKAVGTRILARTTHLLDAAKEVHMTRDVFTRSILPIAVLFSGSLILSNKAYLHLTVSFIQMLKVRFFPPIGLGRGPDWLRTHTDIPQAFNPVAILIIQWIFRIQDMNQRLFMIVLMISGGVCLASYGELRFDLFGFTIQSLAVIFEASRLVMIQVLLHGMKMDPLVSLHYYAPVRPRIISECIN
jgi:hypothetical protein